MGKVKIFERCRKSNRHWRRKRVGEIEQRRIWMKDVKVVEKKTKTKNNKTKQNKKTTKNKKEEHAARLRIHHLSFKSTKKKKVKVVL